MGINTVGATFGVSSRRISDEGPNGNALQLGQDPMISVSIMDFRFWVMMDKELDDQYV